MDGQETEFDEAIEEVVKSKDTGTLEEFIQRNVCNGTTVKCSQHFLHKVDKLVNKSLDQKDSRSASLGLSILHKCGKDLKVPGGDHWLSGLISQGLLLKKMALWFEKCRRLWIQCGPQWNEPLFNLSEDFFDVLMVAHEAVKDETYEFTECFLLPVGQLVVDPRIYILIQKEAIHKFNMILGKIPAKVKKERILTSQEASDIMDKLASLVLECGDYDLQIATIEALCRMSSPVQRKELVNRWFSMAYVASAFVKIRNTDFETDCRKFLNMVNGMHGDKRRVQSFPCLEVYLDKHELLMPVCEELEEFWIDFNLGSHSISFYFSLAGGEAQEGYWETLCINENEVQCYTVQARETGQQQVLQLMLSDLVVVGPVEGSSLTIYFSASLDILQAARHVYGHGKNTSFVGKTCTSEVKTAVKVVVESNSSQAVVPESPLSPGETEKNTAPYCLPTPSVHPPMETPARKKFSESSTVIISSSGGSSGRARSFSAVMPSNTLAKAKRTPLPGMVLSYNKQREIHPGHQRTTDEDHGHITRSSCAEAGGIRDKSKAPKQLIKTRTKSIPLAKAVDMVLAGHGKEQSQEDDFVPDTQPRPKSRTSSESCKLSVSEILMMPTQKITAVSKPELCPSSTKQKTSSPRVSLAYSCPISQKQLHSALTERLEEVLNEQNQDADGKGKSSTLRTSKAQEPQKKKEEKSKVPLTLKANDVDVEAPVKASTTRNLHKMTPNATKRRACSSKAKRDVETTGNMVKAISSRYNTEKKSVAKENIPPHSRIPPLVNRPVFNISWPSTAKNEVSQAVGTRSSQKKTATNTERERDVFAFTADSPSSIGGKGKVTTNTSVLSSSVTRDSTALPITARSREQSAAKGKRHVKKHLFSDTDTDNMTDVSWLRESGRKPPPKMTQYSKRAPVKAKETHISTDESPALPVLPAKTRKQSQPTKKRLRTKKAVGQQKKTVEAAAEPDRPHAAGRKPRRAAAAAAAKGFREMDTDDSLSEVEESCVTQKIVAVVQRPSENTCSRGVVKKKNITSSDQAAAVNRRSSKNTLAMKNSSSLKKPQNVPETTKLNQTKAVSTEEQKNALRGPWAGRQALLSPYPPFIERMRSAERSAPTLDVTRSPLLTPQGSPLPASPDPRCQNTSSPVMLRPTLSIVSSKGGFKPSSFHSTDKKKKLSKCPSKLSFPSFSSPTSSHVTDPSPPIGLRTTEPSPVNQSLFSAPRSALSPSFQPWLTSTLVEKEKLLASSPHQSPSPKAAAVLRRHGGFSNVSPVSQISLSQSGTKSSPSMSGNEESVTAELTVSPKTERTPFSTRGRTPAHPLVSGPSRKRCISVSSDSEEDDRKTKKLRENGNLKPRKLFESFNVTGLLAEGEASQIIMSSSPVVTSGHWEADGDVDTDDDLELPDVDIDLNLCQLFSCELKKKFQDHHMVIEAHKEQSLHILDQSATSLSTEVTKHRTRKSDGIQKVLLDETRKLEQGEVVLSNMQKDLSALWKKQRVSFHCYFEQHSKRNDILKKTVQGNVSSILEYEAKIFTSQKCLMKKGLMSVQDRLLIGMHAGEIQSVKRGLQTLFSLDGSRV